MLGIGLLLFYVATAALQAALSEAIMERCNVFAYVFVSLGLSGLFFLAVSLTRARMSSLAPQARAPYRPGSSAIADLLILNGTTAIAWLGFFVAIQHCSATLAFVVMDVSGPLATIAIDRMLRRPAGLTRIELVVALAAAAAAIWLFVGQYGWTDGAFTALGNGSLLGVLLASIAGTASCGTVVVSKRLADKGIREDEILAHRFYGVIALSAICCILDGGIPSLDVATLAGIAGITLFTVIPSIYAGQSGLKRTTPLMVAIVLTATPALTLLSEAILGSATLSSRTLPPVLMMCFVACAYGWHETRAGAARPMPAHAKATVQSAG